MRRHAALDRAQRFNERGVDQIESERYKEAEESFRWAIEASPDFASAWDNLGVALMHQGRYLEALTALLHAMELDPEEPNCRYNIALILGEHGHEIAMDQLKESLRLDPEYPDADYYLATLHHARNEEETALAHFQRALQLNPEDAKSMIWLARHAYENGEFDRSITLCQKVLDLEETPSEPEVYIGLAHSYAALGEYEQAEEYFERYVMASPYDPYGHYLLACIYATRNQTDLALQSLGDAVSLSREQVQSWSRDDPRLDSLRHDPDYKRLMGEKEGDPE